MSDEQNQVDDIAIEPPENNSDYEAMPAGAYIARLSGFKVEDKPDWKIEQQQATENAKEPEKRREIDPQQYAWTFTISEGEWEGQKITSWQNRSWHENSNSGKYVAALLDIDKIQPDMGLSTWMLIGKPCQLFVTEKNGKNYVDKVLPAPKGKQGPAKKLTERLQAAVLSLNYSPQQQRVEMCKLLDIDLRQDPRQANELWNDYSDSRTAIVRHFEGLVKASEDIELFEGDYEPPMATTADELMAKLEATTAK